MTKPTLTPADASRASVRRSLGDVQQREAYLSIHKGPEIVRTAAGMSIQSNQAMGVPTG